MKKTAIFLIFACFVSLLLAFGVSAEGNELPDLSKVQNVYVYNIENDAELYAKNESDRIYPASTAKIMTGILCVQHFKDNYGQLVTVTDESLGDFKGKNIKLKAGEQLTVEHLLYAMICGGANDAANVLAYTVAGSHQAFLDMMNGKAKELGMTDTFYTNAHGYSDSSMYTTAKDTAKLAKYAYLVQGYMDICTTAKYVLPENNMSKTRYIYNSNYLIATNVERKYRNAEAQGMNAGSTVEGGHVVVTAVTRDGMSNIYVLMGGLIEEENIYGYTAANELIDWSYENFEYKKIIDSSEMICEIDVSLSSEVDYVVLSPDKTVECYLPTKVDVEKDIKREIKLESKKLTAPVEAGHIAGKIVLSYEGRVLAEVDLVTKNNVNRNGLLYVLARIKSFTKSSKFKAIIIVAVIIVLLYILAAVYKRIRGNRYRYKYNRYKKR